MFRQGMALLGATVLCSVISARVQAQDQPPSDQAITPPAAEIAPTAVSLPAPMPCAAACPTSESAIDHDDHSTGWLIIGIGGSVAATSLALGISMYAQAGSNAESRLGSASIAGGVTGLALSLIVGLIAM